MTPQQPCAICFAVPGQPQGKGRARAFLRRGHIRHYTPDKTHDYERTISILAKAAMHGRAPTLQPVQVDLILWFEVPGSWPKWKRDRALDGVIAPTVKPDVDNVVKAIKDALNGIAWHDDCQVVRLSVVKKYSQEPGVLVDVSVINGLVAASKTKRETPE